MPSSRVETRYGVAFAIFACTYFLSALLRAVTATLAPEFTAEFKLGAADLGLLAGSYFLGFALLQLPLGAALDKWGPRATEACLVGLAAVGCAWFAQARTFEQLVWARVLVGMGVSACLMAPLTFFRRHTGEAVQMRLNSWMLMTGSFGMLASTVPVQHLLPIWGWRGLFAGLALLLAVSVLALRLGVRSSPVPVSADRPSTSSTRYRDILMHPVFIRLAPMGFVLYGGLIAIQALWAGPWLTQVCGWSPTQAGKGLLLINAAMLCAFFFWGVFLPRLHRSGIDANRLLTFGVPVGLVALLALIWAGPSATAVSWMGWCVATSVLSISQPAVAQAFPVRAAGRALSAFNLVIFAGVFALQWGIGAIVDGLRSSGFSTPAAFRGAMGTVLALGATSYLWYRVRAAADVHNVGNGPPR